jgi:hypothetical protein
VSRRRFNLSLSGAFSCMTACRLAAPVKTDQRQPNFSWALVKEVPVGKRQIRRTPSLVMAADPAHAKSHFLSTWRRQRDIFIIWRRFLSGPALLPTNTLTRNSINVHSLTLPPSNDART